MADTYNRSEAGYVHAAVQLQAHARAADLVRLAERIDVATARCCAGTATSSDAAFLQNELAREAWMTRQGADLLDLIAERIAHRGGSASDAALLTEFSRWATRLSKEAPNG